MKSLSNILLLLLCPLLAPAQTLDIGIGARSSTIQRPAILTQDVLEGGYGIARTGYTVLAAGRYYQDSSAWVLALEFAYTPLKGQGGSRYLSYEYTGRVLTVGLGTRWLPWPSNPAPYLGADLRLTFMGSIMRRLNWQISLGNEPMGLPDVEISWGTRGGLAFCGGCTIAIGAGFTVDVGGVLALNSLVGRAIGESDFTTSGLGAMVYWRTF